MAFKTLQLRRDTATNWTTNNPILAAGEIGVETGTLQFKIGNGTSTWTALGYAAQTTEQVQDIVGAMAVDTASVNFTYTDAAGTLEAAVLPAGVDHDALSNFVADEHVAHTGVSIATAANSGLQGGGNISATRNLSIDITATQGDVTLSLEADGLKAVVGNVDLGASV